MVRWASGNIPHQGGIHFIAVAGARMSVEEFKLVTISETITGG